METHHRQAEQTSGVYFLFVCSLQTQQTAAWRGACKDTLNIYLVQLFSNSDCGNEKGCLRAPRPGTPGYLAKTVYRRVWL